MDHCCSCGDAAPRAGPDRVAWQDHGLRALNNPPGFAAMALLSESLRAAVKTGADRVTLLPLGIRVLCLNGSRRYPSPRAGGRAYPVRSRTTARALTLPGR